jgi:hypothetical protein
VNGTSSRMTGARVSPICLSGRSDSPSTTQAAL